MVRRDDADGIQNAWTTARQRSRQEQPPVDLARSTLNGQGQTLNKKLNTKTRPHARRLANMLDAMTAFFTLRRTHQPQYRSLPPHITRAFISTPSGDLELLISKPVHPDPKAPPIFFIHGGCGHASVWLEWMTHLHSSGYGGTLYAYSARNHGASYAVPYLRMVYGTSLDDLADDLVACVQAVGEMEGGEGREAVMVGHSSGGGLLQYVLAKGRVKCRGLCLLDAVPHFGNL